MTRIFEAVAFDSNEVHLEESLQALHFAPGRWLVVIDDPSALDELRDRLAIVDVTGKWRRVPLSRAVLASQLPVAATLAGRQCAAVYVFDAPAILAVLADGFEIWTHASYFRHVNEAALLVEVERHA